MQEEKCHLFPCNFCVTCGVVIQLKRNAYCLVNFSYQMQAFGDYHSYLTSFLFCLELLFFIDLKCLPPAD